MEKLVIFDCFTFFNEIRLLDIRLHELYDAVDYFVIVESEATYRGEKKPLYFAENKDLFEPFLHKIISIAIPYPNLSERECEAVQRDMIAEAIRDKVSKDDIVIVSSADEIPMASKVQELQKMEKPVLMWAWLYYYYLNGFVSMTYPVAPVACRYGDLLSIYKTCQKLRIGVIYEGRDNGGMRNSKTMLNASWHFSWMGGIDRIIEKARALHRPDRKIDNPEFLDRKRISKIIEGGFHISGRSEDAIVDYVDIDSSFPKYLFENQHKFLDMIKEIR